MDRKESFEKAREIIIKAINETPFCEEAYPNIKEELLEEVKNYNPKELSD